MSLKDSAVTIRLPGAVDEIRQICPISQNRLMIFGWATGPYNIAIINSASGALLDTFYAEDALLSPDQHWLALVEFHPRQMMVSYSEKYFLYDLSKDRSLNRDPALAQDPDAVGTAMFPVTQSKAAFDNIRVPENQVHEMRSESFYWAARQPSGRFCR